jgi:proteasome lid subunit RPN8/RPN11
MAKTKIKIKAQPTVVMESEVARKIRQHARSSMKAEVCGVLIGSTDSDRTAVQACIPGTNAAQGGTHVTFTQDTWEHIYKIKDREFPDEKIVGWYHSHPGFGVFLSEHDLFIQENFFSSPSQIAWVYDPHTDEEGCFGWIDGKVEKLSGVRFGYLQDVQLGETRLMQDDEQDGNAVLLSEPASRPARQDPEPAIVRWIVTVLSYAAVLGLGFVLGYQFFGYRLQKLVQEEERLYQQMLIQAPPASGVAGAPAPTPAPSASAPQNQKRQKEDDAKH